MTITPQPAQPQEWINHLGGSPVTAFGVGQRSPVIMGHFSYPERPHEFIAPPVGSHYLSVTLAGSLFVERKLDGKKVQGDFRPGTCLLMPANSSNAWRWSEPTEEFQLFIDPDFLCGIARREGIGEGMLDDSFAFVDETIWHFAQMMQSEARNTPLAEGLWVESCARLLAVHLLRHYSVRSDVPRRLGGLTGHQLSKLQSFAQERLHEPLTLEDLSAVLDLSPFHFARQFKKETGKSPHRWLVDLRIARARMLLTNTAMTVFEIATSVGFQSQSRFGVVFKAHTGMTPMAYRQRHFL
ncbi:AraC family transcriptional regulator [Methyloligella sp. 2.7D]